MTRICIVTSHRAERGLLQPLIDRLEAHPDFRLQLMELDPQFDIGINCTEASSYLQSVKQDIVIVPCDRAEALAGALAAFELSIPIIHFHAGDTGAVCKDEAYRHVVSMMADVWLCNGESAKKVIVSILEALHRTTKQVYNIGSTAFDSNSDLDTSMIPSTPYDLILYHPPDSHDPELIRKELDEIGEYLNPDVSVFWGYPGDAGRGSDMVIERIEEVRHRPDMQVQTFKNLPREQFLGLMSRAKFFIGNSSSMIYEAPMWLNDDQIIHVGDRNRNRSHNDIQVGGTDKIVKVLESINWNDLRTGNSLK